MWCCLVPATPIVYEKSGLSEDECLKCADGRIIRDIELGGLFNTLVVQKRVVLLCVLDFCHSDGAFRGDEEQNFRQKTEGFENYVDGGAGVWDGFEAV